MVRLMVAASLVAVGLLPVAPARADIVTFARISGWEAYGGKANDGQQVCGISTSGGGRWIGIKYYGGDNSLTVQMSKNTWKLPNGLHTKVTMQFDDESPWRATATGSVSNGTAFLQFDLPRRTIVPFLSEFKAGDKMYVRFPDEPRIDDWEVDLEGTTAIAQKLFDCIQTMGD